jgi:predicted nucleic acid-binding protein
MNAYPDTSFLASLYVSDANTPEAERALSSLRPVMILTALHELELTNALQLLVFRKLIRTSQASAAQRKFERNVETFGPLRPMAPDVLVRAVDLARRHTARLGARSLDILHVAAALAMDAEAFLTFDIRQRKVASAEGLRVTF